MLVRLHYLGALHKLFCVLGSEQSHILKRNGYSVMFFQVASAYSVSSHETWRRHSLSFVYCVFLRHARGISLKENDLQNGLILL